MKRVFLSFYYIIDLDEYKEYKFSSLNDANEFRYKHNIPCKYLRKRKEYNVYDIANN